MLVAGIVRGATDGDGFGELSRRPDTRRLEGLPRPRRDAVFDQQTAAATRVTDHRDPPVRQQHLPLVPCDPFGRRIWVFDPCILRVLAHYSISPRSALLTSPGRVDENNEWRTWVADAFSARRDPQPASSPASDRRLDHFTPRRWSDMRLRLSGSVLRWGRWLSDSGESVSSFVRSWGVLRTR
jgi:hypothetical protein